MTIGGKKKGRAGAREEREGTPLSIRKQLAWETHAEILKLDWRSMLRQEW